MEDKQLEKIIGSIPKGHYGNTDRNFNKRKKISLLRYSRQINKIKAIKEERGTLGVAEFEKLFRMNTTKKCAQCGATIKKKYRYCYTCMRVLMRSRQDSGKPKVSYNRPKGSIIVVKFK